MEVRLECSMNFRRLGHLTPASALLQDWSASSKRLMALNSLTSITVICSATSLILKFSAEKASKRPDLKKEKGAGRGEDPPKRQLRRTGRLTELSNMCEKSFSIAPVPEFTEFWYSFVRVLDASSIDFRMALLRYSVSFATVLLAKSVRMVTNSG